MSKKTGIEWTDSTWSPIRVRVKPNAGQIARLNGYSSLIDVAEKMRGRVGQHCEHVSPGCENCYAETNNHRCLPGNGTGLPYDRRSRDLVGAFVDERILLEPLKWPPSWDCRTDRHCNKLEFQRPRRIFVENQSDLFGEWVTGEMIDQVFAVMALCPQHVFQVLTKRPERMLAYFAHDGGFGRWGYIEGCARKIAAELKAPKPPAGTTLAIWGGRNLPNVWLGVSVENQAAAFERVPLLLQTPAAVRFISAEPLLGPVTLPGCNGRADCKLSGVDGHSDKPLGGIDWVICGGESGPGARPMHPDWARSLRDQCIAAGVPFFFKQWGEYSPKNRREDLPAHPTMVCEAKGDVLLTIEGKIETLDSCGGVGDHAVMERIGKKAAGALLDGRECKQFPEAE